MEDEREEMSTVIPELEQTGEDAENAANECAGQDTDIADRGEKKPRKKKLLVCLLCLVGLLGIAAISAPYTVYWYACYAMEQRNYETAERCFERLGDFRDSADLRVETEKMQRYWQARALMDGGEYAEARRAFQALGDFRDSKAQMQMAQRMEETVKIYEYAEVDYLSGRYFIAYDEIHQIENRPYEAIPDLKARILDALYEQMMEYWDGDEVLLARYALRVLEKEHYPAVEGLRERLTREKHMELDTSYYDALSTGHITRFNAGTTAEEYATAFKYMYLSHSPSVTLLLNGKRPNYHAAVDRLLQGDTLAQELLPVECSVYDFDWWTYYYEYDPNGVIEIDIAIKPGYAESNEEAKQHVEGIKTYCEETVRMLNDNLLLTNTMSNKAKARVILEWVSNYLEYDDSKVIHDAFVAIENQKGVCESYAAIYNYMCNLAGVPSFGQTGLANSEGPPTKDNRHIWSVQLDEDGNVFYTDATWADNDFSTWGTTEQEFIVYNDEAGYQSALFSQVLDNTIDLYFWAQTDVDTQYFWRDSIWESHLPDTSFSEIQAFYQKNIN